MPWFIGLGEEGVGLLVILADFMNVAGHFGEETCFGKT